MAGTELLAVHTREACGPDADDDLLEPLAAAVVDRVLPWAPPGDGWARQLQATGRAPRRRTSPPQWRWLRKGAARSGVSYAAAVSLHGVPRPVSLVITGAGLAAAMWAVAVVMPDGTDATIVGGGVALVVLLPRALRLAEQDAA